MKGKDLIAVLEYARAFDKPKKPRRRKKDDLMKNFEDLPVDVLLMKLDAAERRADAIKQFIEQRSKTYKKEDKPEKKGWEKMSFIQKLTILTATVPLAMMGYSLLIILFVRIAARAMGL